MAKRNRYEQVISLDPEEFRFALELFNAAVSGQMQRPVGLHYDIPANRGLVAVKEHFKNAEEHHHAFHSRHGALLELIRDRSVQKEEDVMWTHAAVIDLAATAPINRHGKFKKQAFFAEVEKVAVTEKYRTVATIRIVMPSHRWFVASEIFAPRLIDAGIPDGGGG